MRGRSIRIIFGALLAMATLATSAQAQTEPPYRNWDENGVDLVQGDFELSFKEGSIGSGPAELSIVRFGAGSTSTQWDRITYRTTSSGGVFTTKIGLPDGSFEIFENGVNTKANGGTLSGAGAPVEYTATDGTKILFVGWGSDEQPSNLCGSLGGGYPCYLIPESITYPDGRTINFGFFVTSDGALPPNYRTYTWRLLTVTNSFGYRIWFGYSSGRRTMARFQRDGVMQGTVSYAYPTGATVIDVTDFAGNVWRVTGTATTKSIQRPGEATPFISATSSVLVTSSVTRNGVTTNYNRVVNGNTVTMTITNPLGQQTVVTSDLAKSRPTSIKDALNRTTSYQYDANGRMTRVTLPEGNYTQFTYDSRGNVTQARNVSKTPGTPADIVSTASYDATCTNPVKCNEPNSRTDARGNVTDYTYDTTHGAVTSVTRPAPTGGAVRPQTRYSYTLVNGEYQLTGVSQCQTLASCANAADETKTTLTYDVYGNVLTSISGNGTGSLTATQAMTYDTKGDVITVDGPLLGADDTTRIRYDAARRVTGVIAPDPDGAGTLKHRAIRTTLDVAGRVTRQELGTIPGPNPDWANFTSVEAVDVTYDGSGARVATRKLSGGGTAFAMTQSSYDALGRPECSAIRMNPAIYGSLPASACTLGTQGSFGPDRIAKTIYDAAGQVMQRQVAVGTGDVATEATLTYTSNGKLQTLKDAENNLTTYLYDGFDRLKETQYPSATKGSGTSNPADNEVLSYDANSNVTNRRLRDDTGIAFTYDALNRVTLKNLPSGEANVTYAYDNLGRLTSAVQGSQAHSFTYDALSRNLTETGPRGTMTSAWDIAGRRSRLTWPDGFWVDYDYLVTGEMTKVRENDATSGAGVLATFAYDILGRRTSLTRGNGAVTSYGYDPVSRLATLAENFTGSTNDQSSTFTYSPASQIGGVTRTNTAFAWTEHGSGSTASVANGLNQLASIGGAATTHDARGNLTGDPTTGKTYTYTAENRLTNMSSAAGGVNLYYDPLGRLRQMSGGPITDLYLQHDGIQLATEYRINDGAMLKRYVFGPGIDQPLVEYDLAGTRTWLHADERGSVIALSDNSGNVTTINRYDEYGRPQSTNLGRFQYTGQAWLKEIGVYYYKARMYDPALGGRFLQTDPIGPAGGINPYAYVGNDPVNWIDPLGLRWVCVTGPGVDPSTGDVDPGSEVTTCGDNSDPFFDSEVAPLSWTFPRSREFRFTRAGRVNVALAPQQFKIVIVPVQCSSTTSTLGHIAREAGEIADATMGLAFVSGALGLATSETGVGGLTFGGIAVGLGLVSGFASAVQVGAETIDGNRRAATRHALGLTVEQGTSATLSAASKQFGGPGTRLASQAVGQIYGRAISSVTCGM